MKKPHEQEWQQGSNSFDVRDVGADVSRCLVHTDEQTPAEAQAVARFIAATPKMARALVALIRDHDLDCLCDGCSAIRDAGMLED